MYPAATKIAVADTSKNKNGSRSVFFTLWVFPTKNIAVKYWEIVIINRLGNLIKRMNALKEKVLTLLRGFLSMSQIKEMKFNNYRGFSAQIKINYFGTNMLSISILITEANF